MTGSMDQTVRMYNFGAMSSTLQPYRSLEPDPGHVVTAVAWNARGNKVAMSCGSSTAHVLTRDAQKIVSCVKGDPYINDMKNTKGHVGVITRLVWHPSDASMFLTGSIDGSVRVWHLEEERTFGKLICRHVLKARNSRGTRVGVTSVAYGKKDGSLIAATCEDGSLQVWRGRDSGSYGRPDFMVSEAHTTPLSKVGGSFSAGRKRQMGDDSISTNADRPSFTCFSPDGLAIATRGGAQDNTIKLWDVRMLSGSRGPLKIFSDVYTCGPSSNMSFGEPGDGSLILVAASSLRQTSSSSSSVAAMGGDAGDLGDNGDNGDAGDNGKMSRPTGELLYFRCKTSKSLPTHRTAFPESCCPVTVSWQSATQHLAVGCSDGTCRVFFDEDMSTKGAMLLRTSAATTKRVKKSDGYARIETDSLVTNGVELQRAAQAKRRKLAGEDTSSFNGAGPERPNQDLKEIGKRGDKKSFTQMIMKYRTKNTIINTDPREALLKYHNKDGKSWTGEAYAASDPNRVLAETTLEEEDEQEQSKKEDR